MQLERDLGGRFVCGECGGADRECGDAREVHHCALLLGYGAGAINPYLAFETLDDMIRQRILVGITHEQAMKNYIRALNKGILKVMSKMGISTVQSYCGAQIFEAVGIDRDVMETWFTGTPYALYAHVRAITPSGTSIHERGIEPDIAIVIECVAEIPDVRRRD